MKSSEEDDMWDSLTPLESVIVVAMFFAFILLLIFCMPIMFRLFDIAFLYGQKVRDYLL